MMDALQQLWESTETLHRRFYPAEPPSFEARRRVLFEEFGEFTAAIDLWVSPVDEPLDQPVSEAADLIVTILGVLMYQGWTCDDLIQDMLLVAEKNNRKSLTTHEVRADGKIARRQA